MNSKIHVIFVLLIGVPKVSCLFGFIGSEQSVGVKGNLTCNGQPAKNVTLMLYDEEIISDTLLEKEQLDTSGVFEIHGVKREVSTIEPYMAIQHHCRVMRGCHKTVIIDIPKPFVFKGSSPDVYYDIYDVDLSLSTIPSKFDCPH